MKQKLDSYLVGSGLLKTRSEARSYINMQAVKVNGKLATKVEQMVGPNDRVRVIKSARYVSRAGFKLASVAKRLKLDFRNKVVLDVGSSTGGFTDYALQNGAIKVIAVDIGSKQLHPTLKGNKRIELHEKTDIRDLPGPIKIIDIVVIDVSFISVREILPAVFKLASKPGAQIVVMLKPQFEVGDDKKHKGIIKNSKIRRDILKDFEVWVKMFAVIIDKSDSEVSGQKGNVERFYLLKSLKRS